MIWRIKIHRKITERERYTNWNVVRLFFHCLLKANHSDKNWQWINIDRWSFITSIEHLAIELKLSQQQIRTAITKLEITWELVKKSTNKFTLITLVKYSDYNDLDIEDNKQITNQQQTNNKQITTTKNDKNNKEWKEDIYRSINRWKWKSNLEITSDENSKLLDEWRTQNILDREYDNIENYSKNWSYKSLYLTARKRLEKKEKPKWIKITESIEDLSDLAY